MAPVGYSVEFLGLLYSLSERRRGLLCLPAEGEQIQVFWFQKTWVGLWSWIDVPGWGPLARTRGYLAHQCKF